MDREPLAGVADRLRAADGQRGRPAQQPASDLGQPPRPRHLREEPERGVSHLEGVVAVHAPAHLHRLHGAVAHVVILEPTDEWSEAFKACLGSWEDEIPRPTQESVVDLPNRLA